LNKTLDSWSEERLPPPALYRSETTPTPSRSIVIRCFDSKTGTPLFPSRAVRLASIHRTGIATRRSCMYRVFVARPVSRLLWRNDRVDSARCPKVLCPLQRLPLYLALGCSSSPPPFPLLLPFLCLPSFSRPRTRRYG